MQCAARARRAIQRAKGIAVRTNSGQREPDAMSPHKQPAVKRRAARTEGRTQSRPGRGLPDATSNRSQLRTAQTVYRSTPRSARTEPHSSQEAPLPVPISRSPQNAQRGGNHPLATAAEQHRAVPTPPTDQHAL